MKKTFLKLIDLFCESRIRPGVFIQWNQSDRFPLIEARKWMKKEEFKTFTKIMNTVY